MAVDWKVLTAATECSRAGDNVRAIEMLSELLTEAESDTDRAVIMLGQASCYSHLRDMANTFELLASARNLAQGDRATLLQVAMSEGSAHELNGAHELACHQFATVKSEYADLLSEDKESTVELDSRFACALVNSRRYEDAIKLFKKLFAQPEPIDTQWLQVHFGLALANTGKLAAGQSLFLSASQGKNQEIAATALEYLSASEKAQ